MQEYSEFWFRDLHKYVYVRKKSLIVNTIYDQFLFCNYFLHMIKAEVKLPNSANAKYTFSLLLFPKISPRVQSHCLCSSTKCSLLNNFPKILNSAIENYLKVNITLWIYMRSAPPNNRTMYTLYTVLQSSDCNKDFFQLLKYIFRLGYLQHCWISKLRRNATMFYV